MIEESKRRADKDFEKLSEKYKEDIRQYWKKIKQERGKGANVSSEGNEVKDMECWMLREKGNVKGMWREYFEKVVIINSESDAIGMCMRMIGGGIIGPESSAPSISFTFLCIP